MEIIFIGISVLSLMAAGIMYKKTSNIMKRMDEMVENAMEGTLLEEEYNESRLCRLEAKLYRYLCSNRVQQRKMASEQDAVKMLVSDISHQTKTPVSNLLLYAQLLCEKEELDENARSIAYQIEGQAEKLSFLIQSLIKISRLENGIVAVKPERNRIRELIRQIVCPTEAMEKNITFEVEGEIPDIAAYFDLKWTLEALSNIIDNGIKYTPRGGKVSVCVREYEMFVRIDVKDTGIGISEEDSAKIFTRFYRSANVRNEKGVGIGLYLAREIVSRESGYIKVSSEVGRGSVFSVFLAKEENLSRV